MWDWRLSLIIDILIIRDGWQPQREQQIQVKWKCCPFVCGWPESLTINILITRDRGQPQRSIVLGCCVVTVTFIY